MLPRCRLRFEEEKSAEYELVVFIEVPLFEKSLSPLNCMG